MWISLKQRGKDVCCIPVHRKVEGQWWEEKCSVLSPCSARTWQSQSWTSAETWWGMGAASSVWQTGDRQKSEWTSWGRHHTTVWLTNLYANQIFSIYLFIDICHIFRTNHAKRSNSTNTGKTKTALRQIRRTIWAFTFWIQTYSFLIQSAIANLYAFMCAYVSVCRPALFWPETDLGSLDQLVAAAAAVEVVALEQLLLYKHAPQRLLQAVHTAHRHGQVQEVLLWQGSPHIRDRYYGIWQSASFNAKFMEIWLK